MYFTFPISYIYNKSFRLSFHALPYFILQLLPHYKHRDCCFKILSVLHDTNMLPITYLRISITRYCFLPSLSHRFALSQSGLTRMLYPISYYEFPACYIIYHISYYELITLFHIMNKGAVVTKYCFILLGPNMVFITNY